MQTYKGEYTLSVKTNYYVSSKDEVYIKYFICTVFLAQCLTEQFEFIFLSFSEQNSGISSFYIQGKRINGWSPYLYNDGTTITYFNWSTGQPSGVGLYLATASADTRMQTDDGTSPRSYVCAVYPPTSLPAR